MIDCGLFQGAKELRLNKLEKMPEDFKELDLVILTHAHLDHTGYLPILIKNGYVGKIYCTRATKDLTEIILLDGAKIQEEDARRANEHHYTKHDPAKPLYDIDDAKLTMTHFETFDLDTWNIIDDSIKFKFINSGHILGSAFIVLDVNGKIIVFSGDIGRKKPLILNPFEYLEKADYLIVKSTYGNRNHKNTSIIDLLLKYINHTYSKGGILMIPTFSVERAQEIIYLLSLLKRDHKLPNIPIFLDSPMGVNATEVYFKYKDGHKLSDEDIKSIM